MYMYIYICMYVCMYMYMYMCIYVYMYMTQIAYSRDENSDVKNVPSFSEHGFPRHFFRYQSWPRRAVSHTPRAHNIDQIPIKKKNRTDNVPDWRGGKLLPLLCFPRSLSPEPTLKSQIKSSPLVTHHLIKPPPPPSSLSIYMLLSDQRRMKI